VRVAVVTARPPTGDDPRSRHARDLAARLGAAGLTVEHLTADHAVAPRLWENVRQRAATFDIVHVLGTRALPAVVAAHGRARGVVFSPQDEQGPASLLRRVFDRPSGAASRALMDAADRIVCSSRAEAQRLVRLAPSAAARTRIVPLGIDAVAIRRAHPLPGDRKVVLAIAGPGRDHRVDRVIAALADLGASFELVVGGGPLPRRQLLAHAAELGVGERVRLLGRLEDAVLHRWLRTARVVVTLSERWANPQVVLAALAAGTPVIASEAAPHLDAARQGGEAGVTIVPGDASPLTLADAVSAAASVRLSPSASPGLPTIDDELRALLAVYGELVEVPGLDAAPGIAAAVAGTGRFARGRAS
jgi:glycosyltransferase involved in cell wall biosynthesis